ncbi:uncharacterized protein LOC122154093 isoform X2 [Tyto alba]|uniref:uncharacterized protein LOC122154093 isoform X1 n=1 Tax=Tyto alba TaxID=56313 RepID=UPI001C671325|nr:uncharacterized protein LOC122154093 isoform X1 [Tyto alba]XP_042656224.1 uncharacterized protein LOC122154093 isoform X2 [Tyto alba]
MLLTALAHFVNKAGACSLAALSPHPSAGPCPGHKPRLRWVRAPEWAPLPPAPRLCKPQAPPVRCDMKTREGEKNNSNQGKKKKKKKRKSLGGGAGNQINFLCSVQLEGVWGAAWLCVWLYMHRVWLYVHGVCLAVRARCLAVHARCVSGCTCTVSACAQSPCTALWQQPETGSEAAAAAPGTAGTLLGGVQKEPGLPQAWGGRGVHSSPALGHLQQPHVLSPRVGGGPEQQLCSIRAPVLLPCTLGGHCLSKGASCLLAHPANASLLSCPLSVLYLFPLPLLLWLGPGSLGKGCWLPGWDGLCCRGGWQQMCPTKMQLFLSLSSFVLFFCFFFFFFKKKRL